MTEKEKNRHWTKSQSCFRNDGSREGPVPGDCRGNVNYERHESEESDE